MTRLSYEIWGRSKLCSSITCTVYFILFFCSIKFDPFLLFYLCLLSIVQEFCINKSHWRVASLPILVTQTKLHVGLLIIIFFFPKTNGENWYITLAWWWEIIELIRAFSVFFKSPSLLLLPSSPVFTTALKMWKGKLYESMPLFLLLFCNCNGVTVMICVVAVVIVVVTTTAGENGLWRSLLNLRMYLVSIILRCPRKASAYTRSIYKGKTFGSSECL